MTSNRFEFVSNSEIYDKYKYISNYATL